MIDEQQSEGAPSVLWRMKTDSPERNAYNLRIMHEGIATLLANLHEEEEQPYPEVQLRFDVPDEQEHHEEERHEEEHHEEEHHETEPRIFKNYYDSLCAERKRINEEIRRLEAVSEQNDLQEQLKELIDMIVCKRVMKYGRRQCLGRLNNLRSLTQLMHDTYEWISQEVEEIYLGLTNR
jgi:signal recognition particle GTPase